MIKHLKLLKLPFLLLSATLLIVSGCTDDSSLEDALTQKEEDSNVVKFSKRSSDFNFTASLKGHNEVPPVSTNATGNVIVKISKDESSVYYKVTVGNIDNVRASHFHMAPTDKSGPVVVAIFSDSDQPAGRTNGILTEGTITAEDVRGPLAGDLDAFIDRIRRGRIYVNVHTVEVPSGELRGNL